MVGEHGCCTGKDALVQPKSTRIGRWHKQIMISVRLLAAVAQPVWRVHRIPTNSPASQQLAAQACHRLPFCRLCLCLGCHGLGGAPARLPPHGAVAAGQEGPQPVWAGLDQRQGKTHHSTCCRCLARGSTHHPLCCRCLARGGLRDFAVLQPCWLSHCHIRICAILAFGGTPEGFTRTTCPWQSIERSGCGSQDCALAQIDQRGPCWG